MVVVFDWDGTLIDSAGKIIACMQQAARDAALAPPTDEQVRNIIGLGLDLAIARLYPDAAQRQRGSTCKVRCRTGYLSVQDSNYSFVCEQSTHPSWEAIDPSKPPRCVKDGCYGT